MTIIVEVSVPPDALAIGNIFEEHTDAKIELERTVPVKDDLMPYFWLSNGGNDLADVITAIREHSDTKSLTKLSERDDRALFEVVWKPTVECAVAALRQDHCGCLEVTGTIDGWELQLRFSDRENVMGFNETLTAEGVPVTLQRLDDISSTTGPKLASPEQLEAIQIAHEAGYFHVPRECSIEELAEETDISNSAFSERLRRGLDRLIDRTDFEAVKNEY